SAPHDPKVEAGSAPLLPGPLEGRTSLGALLAQPGMSSELRRRARAASMQDAEAELGRVRAAVLARAAAPERLRGRIREALLAAGAQAALHAVPVDVLVEAFREELDARSRLHRWVRTPFRGLATVLTAVGRRTRQLFTGDRSLERDPAEEMDRVLRDGLARALESLAPELAAWEGEARTRELLARALSNHTLSALASRGLFEAQASPADREGLRVFCRELVRQELPGGFAEGALQTLATLVYSVPAGAAAAVTVASGGLGHDAAVWAGTLLSAPLMERFVDALGSGVRRNVALAWADQHGRTLALAAEAQLFRPLLQHLDAEVAAAEATAARLRRAEEAVAEEARR
ncbi:MAG TPA: hypothetical protein VK454_14385, partial [Myxococcaceae bacterium]|nr:hypothetical protein [Myxococcaceae bacterium]